MNLEQKLRRIVLNQPWLMEILRAVRTLSLPDWAVAGGVIRNTVWDDFHGFRAPSVLRDVDVVYFDPSRETSEQEIEQRLSLLVPGYEWQAANEARMHEWQAKRIGRPVPAYESTSDAISTWIETATAVGLRLERDDGLSVIAPIGLDDLFLLRLRANPQCPDPQAFARNLKEKRFIDHWPRLQLVD